MNFGKREKEKYTRLSGVDIKKLNKNKTTKSTKQTQIEKKKEDTKKGRPLQRLSPRPTTELRRTALCVKNIMDCCLRKREKRKKKTVKKKEKTTLLH